VPAGDILRRLRLPSWLRWLLELVRGTRIQAGPVDVLLDERPTPPRTGLDVPHQPKAPKVGGGRWPA
jgi:hypothetical protein